MAKFTIPGFRGGIADSLYDPLSKQTYQSAKNLDVLNELNILKPLTTLTTLTMPSAGGVSNARFINGIQASDKNYYFIGKATISAATNFVLYHTSALSASPTWTQDYAVVDSDATSPSLEEYLDGIFFEADDALKRWGDLSGSPAITQISNGFTNRIRFLRTHPGLGKLFIVHNFGHTIASYDNSSVDLSALVLYPGDGEGDTAVGIEPYGAYCLIGVRSLDKRSRFILWDGSSTTYYDAWDTGEYGLMAFRVIGSTIHFLCLRQPTGNNVLRYYQMSPGSRPQLIKEFKLGTTTYSGGDVFGISTASEAFRHAMDVDGEDFIFGPNGATYSLLGQFIWRYGSGSQNPLLTNHRTTTLDATSDVVFTAIRQTTNNTLVFTRNDASSSFTTEATGISSAPLSTGEYESNVFPLNDDGKEGSLTRITINHLPLPASCGFTVKIRHFGNYPWGTTVPSVEAYTDIITPDGSGSSTGKTQSTANAVMTEITSSAYFKKARYAQIKIVYDEVSSTEAPSIIFPVHIETTP